MRWPVAVLTVLLLAACMSAEQSTERPGSDGRDSATVAGTETSTPATSSEDAASTTSGVPGFTFAAAGDIGATPETAKSLHRLDQSAAAFFLALGDMDYDDTPTDEAWCDYVTDRLPSKGAGFPFEVLVGNHEADGGPDGRISNHSACLQDRLGSQGRYGAQYAFGYPAPDPLARFVLVAPGLTVDGHRYDYRKGTADRRWLVRQMRQAKAAGQWLVVGMHFPCISMGKTHGGCDSGRAVHNLVLRRGADLLLTGHNHIYERSKQIELSRSCPRVGARFDGDCVTDAGKDGVYRKGRGTVQVTSGRFGGRFQGIDRQDPDHRWFVKGGARTTGFLEVRVTRGRLAARYVPSTGSLADSFVVRR